MTKEQFDTLLSIAEFNSGDEDSKKICTIMFKTYLKDNKIKDISAIDLYNLIIDKETIEVFVDDKIETIKNFNDYKEKILNNDKENNNL